MNRLAIAALLLAFAQPSFADTTVDLDIYDVQIILETIDGEPVEKRVLSPLSSPAPGDLLSYRLTVENADEQDASDLTFSLPLDANLSFETGSFKSDRAGAVLLHAPDPQSGDDIPQTIELGLDLLNAREKAVLEFDIRVK